MLAFQRLQYRNVFKSQKIINQATFLLETALQKSSPLVHLTCKVHRRNPPLPSVREGTFGSQYIPLSPIEKTEKTLEEIFSEKSIQTVSEWNDIKNDLFIKFEILSEVNFSSIVMNSLLSLNRVDEAHSFMKYLHDANIQSNFLCYLKYMALCGKNVDKCGEQIVFQTFEKIKSMIDASPVLDVTRTELVIQGLYLTTQWQLCFDYLKKLPCELTREIKNHLATAAIKNDQEVLAWEILTTWLKNGENPSNEVITEFLLYAQRLQFKDWRISDKFIVNFFQYIQKKGIILNMKVIKFVESYFKLHPTEWEVSRAKVFRSGECKSCKRNLEIVDFTIDDFMQLKDIFLERSLKKNDLFINTTNKEFHHSNPEKSKNLAIQLSKIVNRLSNHSDRLLVLGRQHMLGWPRSIMNKISEKASVFLTNDSSEDDPFMVYAALASGPDCCIVSQDLMRDHAARLDNPKFIWLFQRWQQTHQIYLSISEDGKFKFMEPLKHSINIQGDMEKGWHIPYDDGIILDAYEELNNWLCIHR
ncbi:mitochondrial ribonuclease P protein 3 [Trichonephila inaurata madagascariensis]|uniref:Mitochondrial ribonuclease P catalytic subunit n=1 Tax=Trichonephila inaurata madagascariensis TaxID=2747483 RepID=A0A8X6JRY5_9ARAC|nr:mitochondrial ribonuclease P protein 3 [Trichonephila inaurata madagascariensis]